MATNLFDHMNSACFCNTCNTPRPEQWNISTPGLSRMHGCFNAIGLWFLEVRNEAHGGLSFKCFDSCRAIVFVDGMVRWVNIAIAQQ